jgi:hypothetical protein
MRTHSIRAVLLCAAVAACGEDTGTRATAAGPSLAGAPPACVEFGPPPAPGTIWGSPAGHLPGTVVHTENGIDVSVEPLNWVGGGGTFNFAEIDLPPAAFGSGQVAGTNNIHLRFNFMYLGWVTNKVHFTFLDLGGNENLKVNSSAYHVGELTAAPAVLGSRNVNVAWSAVPGGKTGQVTIWGGPIKSMVVGGQEFWIDRVCAEP